jgi:hypothetical protein
MKVFNACQYAEQESLAHFELALNEFHTEMIQSAANGKDLKKPKMVDKAVSNSNFGSQTINV